MTILRDYQLAAIDKLLAPVHKRATIAVHSLAAVYSNSASHVPWLALRRFRQLRNERGQVKRFFVSAKI